MDSKIRVGNRYVTQHAADTALEEVATTGKFSRSVFAGNGVRGLLGLGSRKPRSPEKVDRLWDQAYELARDLKHPRKLDIKRRRDEELLNAIYSKQQSPNTFTFGLNSKSYAFVDMGGRTYTYVDVSANSGYRLEKSKGSGLPHVVAKGDNEVLGRVAVNPDDLKNWIARAPDGSSIRDPAFATKIKARPEWRDHHTDEKAISDLSNKAPGIFQFYSGDSENALKLAFKDVDRIIRVKEFDSKTGQMVGGENVFRLIGALDRMRDAYVNFNARVVTRSDEVDTLIAQGFEWKRVVHYLAWKNRLGRALAKHRGSPSDRRAIEKMLLAANGCHPTDLRGLLARAAVSKPGESENITQLRQEAAVFLSRLEPS